MNAFLKLPRIALLSLMGTFVLVYGFLQIQESRKQNTLFEKKIDSLNDSFKALSNTPIVNIKHVNMNDKMQKGSKTDPHLTFKSFSTTPLDSSSTYTKLWHNTPEGYSAN